MIVSRALLELVFNKSMGCFEFHGKLYEVGALIVMPESFKNNISTLVIYMRINIANIELTEYIIQRSYRLRGS